MYRHSVFVDCEENDEDYSASVSAIMQRKNSEKMRRHSSRRRRPSSPEADGSHLGARRRSSVFTTSSGEYVFCFLNINLMPK